MINDAETYDRLWQGLWAASPMMLIGLVMLILVLVWPVGRGR